ncbi:helix-turn-helix transcriptional regulator [Arthrobacter sp. H14]|uniref:helix-turn-helix transcriptional regulator n=1 Tax=Arthrobacter sp. H14 TaxID=1312959 RepID=UPI00056A6614|nr:helix-turn-helix transcriptional regulator [Arthrobacter sp. H14]
MSTELVQVLAEAVRSRRESLRLTQTDVADLAGVSERFVRFLEHGKPTVQLDSVLAVLDTLGLDLRLERKSGVQHTDETR